MRKRGLCLEVCVGNMSCVCVPAGERPKQRVLSHQPSAAQRSLPV